MTRRLVVTLAKGLWLACVAIAVVYFMHRSWPKLHDGLLQMRLSLVGASLALTVAAKFVLGENARIAARRSGIHLPYGTALRLYNLSQLGKYMPGSVWQFVGRAAAYRDRGASYGAIRDSLLIESLWVVLAALIIGASLVGTTAVSILRNSASPAIQAWLAALVAIALIAIVLAWIFKRDTLKHYMGLLIPSVPVVLVQLGAWLLLGLAFWVLIVAMHLDVGPVYATGLFALAFALGFMVPIAPAGLGIRDGILTFGLLPFGSLQSAVAVTVVARLVYLVAELGLVGVQELLLALLNPSSSSAPR